MALPWHPARGGARGAGRGARGAGRGMKVYTRTGDGGRSSLYTGERRSKAAAVFSVLGDVDELNCAVGVAREFAATDLPAREGCPLGEQLEEVQSRLLDVGSAVATPPGSASDAKAQRAHFDAGHADRLEGWIDAMEEELPPLKNFILPSGGRPASFLHAARAVCRRAERQVVGLAGEEEEEAEEVVEPSVRVYLNRLSDYLFTAARYAALREGKPEVVYKKE